MQTKQKNRTISVRYAKALFELACETGQEKEILTELELLGLALKSVPLLMRALEDRDVAQNKKHEVIKELAGLISLSPHVINSILMLIDRNLINALPDIINNYREMYESLEQMTHIHASIADSKLVEATKNRLETILSDILKRKAICEVDVKPSLIGGLVIKMGDVVIDGSVMGKLKRMREELL